MCTQYTQIDIQKKNCNTYMRVNVPEIAINYI